jgi:hypothetical protein
VADYGLDRAMTLLQLQQELIEWQQQEIVRLRLERDAALQVKWALTNLVAGIDDMKFRLNVLVPV